MDSDQSKREYGYLRVTTRPGESEKGKSKVLLVMHEDDRAAYEELITQDLLTTCSCALFTLKAGALQELLKDEEGLRDHLQNIGEMRIVVAAVTKPFLSEDCFARKSQVSEAVRNNVAVLPVLVEGGLVDMFNSDPVFSGMQFLDRTSTDATELGYETKLKNYLDSLILTESDVSDIRKHHTGHAFLSYRKKDREYAKKLMAIIHDIKQDLAIWYDEFLTPGKHFDDEIADTIRKSELFTMAMTPNMLEKPNYVEEHEYKAASEEGKDILPVTMKDMGNADVDDVYPGIGTCIDAGDKAAIGERMDGMSGRFTGYTGDVNTAEHKYYIALGFLNGIDMETDSARAEKLLHEAAEQKEGHYSKEAYRRLVSMYLNGAGAHLSRDAAKETQRDLFDFCREEFLRTSDFYDLADMINEQLNLGGLYYDDNDRKTAGDIYEDAADLITKAVLETNAGKDKLFCSMIYKLGSLAFTRLGVMLAEVYSYKEAGKYVEAGIAVDKQMSAVLSAKKDPYLLLCDEGSINESMALSSQISGDFRTAVDLFLRNVEIEKEILSMSLSDYDPDEVRRISLGKIVGWYSRAANNAIMAGWYDEAREYCQKSLDAFQELGGNLKLMGDPDQQGDVFWTYFHLSEIGRLNDDFQLMSDAAEEGVKVLEEIIEQSSAEKWQPYLVNLRDRITPKELTEEQQKAKDFWSNIPYNEHGAPDYTVYNPFGDALEPYSFEDNYETLKKVMNYVEYMMNTGIFVNIARDDFISTRDDYYKGKYDLSPDKDGKNKAAVEAWIKDIEKRFAEKGVYIEGSHVNSEDEPEPGEDIPFGEEDIPASEEDDLERLLDDIEMARVQAECGYVWESIEDLEWIIEKLDKGRYNVDASAALDQKMAVTKLVNKLKTENS